MNWLDRLERKMRRFSIPRLMDYIIGGMGIVFLANLLLPVDLYRLFALDMGRVLQGEIWRLVTFIFFAAVQLPAMDIL